MRWRPALSLLGVLTAAAVVVVAMSSASVPTADAQSASADLTPAPPEDSEPEPRANNGATAARLDAEVSAARDTEVSAAAGSGSGADATIGVARSPTTPDSLPPICAELTDPVFDFHGSARDCYLLIVADEQHRELTEEELTLITSVPEGIESAAQPLGRPAREIRSGPPGAPGAPRLYLTFDDGPSRTWTRPTLDLLDRFDARATFFPVGAYAEPNFDLIAEITERGHTIGTHLWSHDRAALYDEELFRQELRASADLLGEHLTNCLRTPYGIISEEILEWAGEEGFEVVLWGDLDPLDWQAPGIEELTQRILEGVRPGTILLLHERTGGNTLAALEATLEALAAAGWRFDEPICPLQF